MDLLSIYLLITMMGCVVLIVAYSVTLHNAYKGSKYKFVYQVIIMLILSNIGGLIIVYTNYYLFVDANFKKLSVG